MEFKGGRRPAGCELSCEFAPIDFVRERLMQSRKVEQLVQDQFAVKISVVGELRVRHGVDQPAAPGRHGEFRRPRLESDGLAENCS